MNNSKATNESIDALLAAEKHTRIVDALHCMQQTSSNLLLAHGEWEHTWKVIQDARVYKADVKAQDHFHDFMKQAPDMVRLYSWTQENKRITVIGYKQPRQNAALNIRIFVQNIKDNTLPLNDDGIECYLPSSIENGTISYIQCTEENGLVDTYTLPWNANMEDDEFDNFQQHVTATVQGRIEAELERNNMEQLQATQTSIQKRLQSAIHSA